MNNVWFNKQKVLWLCMTLLCLMLASFAQESPTLNKSPLSTKSAKSVSAKPVVDTHDPFEKYNRSVFAFNWNFYKSFMIPVIKVTYLQIPLPIRNVMGNVTTNLASPVNAIDFLLRGEVRESFRTVTRFGINTTFGILGIFDVAKIGGVPYHKTSFDDTLAAWGVPPGPFLVVPFLFPSSVRGTTSIVVDFLINPDKLYILPNDNFLSRLLIYSIPVTGLSILYTSSPYLQQAETIAATSLDFYGFSRQLYFSSLNTKLKGNVGFGHPASKTTNDDPFANAGSGDTSNSDPFDTVDDSPTPSKKQGYSSKK